MYYRSPISYPVGSRIEARFRGKMRFYPGVIKHYRRADDTFDIDYDDGEIETHVRRDLLRLPVAPVKISPRQDIISPASNPFARPSDAASSAALNPFARQGAAVNPFPTAFSSPPQRDDSGRVSTAAALSRDSGLGAYVPSENQVSRRGIRTADSVTTKGGLPEVVPKSQLAHLKYSISSSNGMNAPKRRSSKGADADGNSDIAPNSIPALDMKHSRSEQNFSSSTQQKNVTTELIYSKESPRSNESTPRRLDPLSRRKVGETPLPAADVRTRAKPPPTAPAIVVSQVVAQEFCVDDNMWQCKKCLKNNPVIPDVDYCDNCAARRGATGQIGISTHVRKYA